MTNHRIGPITKRLELRAIVDSDAESFYALNSHPDVMRLTGEPPLKSLQESRDAIANYTDFKNPGYGRWGCILKSNQQLIGFCGLKYLDDLNEVDLGYRFLPQYWGQGLATEACIATLKFGFNTLELQRIIALVLPQNTASIRVLQKIGMHHECDFQYDGYQVQRYEILQST